MIYSSTNHWLRKRKLSLDVRETDRMLTFSEVSIAHSFKFPSDSPVDFLKAIVLKLRWKKNDLPCFRRKCNHKQMMLTNGIGPRLGLWECKTSGTKSQSSWNHNHHCAGHY